MRVLFSPLPTRGHLLPMVPLAWALQAAGHEVSVAAPESFAGAVLETGLSHLSTVDHIDMRRMIGFDRAGNPVPDVPDLDGKLARSGRGFGRASVVCLDAMDELVRAWRPDLVVSDPAEFAARIAAGRRGIPAVIEEWGMPIPPVTSAAMHDELSAETAELETTNGVLGAHFIIETMPAELTTSDGADRRPMRFVPFNGSASIPNWLLHNSERTRVCLTFGSMIGAYPGSEKPIAALAQRLAEDGYEVLLAVGEEVAARLPVLPDLVRRIGWLPLNKVLPTCRLLVHHGGSGSAMTAIALGVPQVGMPYASDQFSNSECVARLGLGQCLVPGSSEPEHVSAACAEILADPAYDERAEAQREAMAKQPSPAALAETLAELVG